MKFSGLIFILVILCHTLCAQQASVSGSVTGENANWLAGVTIKIKNTGSGVVSDRSGYYRIIIPAGEPVVLVFSHVGYAIAERSVSARPDEKIVLNIVLEELTEVLKGVEIEGDRENQVSTTKINPKSLEALPSPFGDFNRILSTLPGVVSNNELSSTYSVRGGSFDENLIYVNDIPIYRPFLVSNGQQEGLSFVNSDLVEEVIFSAGGWQAKYGDKLSSVLNVDYKEPSGFDASLTAGLLGGSAHVEGLAAKGTISYVAGVRRKSAQYLLNTLETEGEYLPKFTDVQAFVNFQLNDKTSLGLLTTYARNRYSIVPESRITEFGTFRRSYRLFVGFEGQEILEYDTYQGGLKFMREIGKRWKATLIASGVYASEREFTDVEGTYRLCDVDKVPGSDTYNKCVFVRGTGSNYDYGRNMLEANIINIENRNEITINEKNKLEWGFGYSYKDIEDQLSEYSFKDSANFVIDIHALQADNELVSDQYTGYIQHTSDIRRINATYGVRFNYWDVNGQLLISPRTQFSFRPDWTRDVIFTTAAGIYQQPPFYRELRGQQGDLNTELEAQRALHVIGGLNYNFTWWKRNFKFTGEIYYKRLRDVVIYDIDNVKVRYYAHNNAKAYATGLDLRISGEFIEGAESWFSLGLLNTREDIMGDGRGYIRRPTDQRLNVAAFFQDHLPDNPTFRVKLNLFFGSGLPFGPPRNFERRNVYNGDTYRRIDIGFSKIFYLNAEEYGHERQLILSAEILNLLGVSNTISYTWITDINNDQFAVPNTLSARFLNVKVSVKI